MTYAVLIPLKATSRGKSRLGLPDDQRQALAMAMARDTVRAARAARAVSSVLVIAETPVDGPDLRAVGASVMTTAATGLNPAILDGARALLADRWAGPVAVLPGDLPFLTPDDLDAALLAADQRFAGSGSGSGAGWGAVVADAAGVGTTLLVAARVDALHPHYGPDSFRRHVRAGAVALPIDAASTLHLDVDTLADLKPADVTPAYRRPTLGEDSRSAVAGLHADGFCRSG